MRLACLAVLRVFGLLALLARSDRARDTDGGISRILRHADSHSLAGRDQSRRNRQQLRRAKCSRAATRRIYPETTQLCPQSPCQAGSPLLAAQG